jgi:hypothetical protein
MATTYKIVLHGIKGGEDLSGVVTRVMALVKLPRERVLRMLTNPGVAIKHGLDAQKAAKYEAVLERAGCNVILAPDLANVALPAAAHADRDEESATGSVSANARFRGLFGKLAGASRTRRAAPVRANYEEMRARANRNWRAKLRSLTSALQPSIGQWVGRLRG